MNITKFNEKLNKLEGNTYTIEEVVTPVNGVYEADLRHDNVEPNTINIYTGSKLTGDRINSYTISTPSLTPWRTHIKIYSSISPLYITYETIGDTVEADDINTVQNAINDTQKALNNEMNSLTTNINNEITRATNKENTITTNLNNEVTRAKNAEKILTDNLNSEINRAKTKENDINTALNNRYTKDQTFTKNEVLQKIQDVIGTAPEALNTLQEISKALNNDSNFAGTVTTELSNKADKSHTHTKSQITDMPTKLSQFTNDKGFITSADVDSSQNHMHSNKTVLDKIIQNSLDSWNDKLPTKKITTVTDLDTLRETCVYYIKVGNCPNNPSSNWGTLFVSNEGTLYQIFVPDSSSSFYKRNWNGSNSSWSSWIDLRATDGDGKQINTTYVKKGMTWAELEGK